jgi:hypothetical protein
MRAFGFVLVFLAGFVFLYQGVATTLRENVWGPDVAETVKAPVKTLPVFPFWVGWALVGGTILIAVNDKPVRDRR